MSQVKPNLLDRAIGYFSPFHGACRLQARAAMDGFSKSGKSSFDAVGKSPFNRNRYLKGGSGDDHLDHSDLWELREISRSMDFNSGLTTSILDRVSENVVGPGGYEIKPQTKSKKINKRIKRDFSFWFDNFLDHRREFSGWSLIRRSYRGGLRDGDGWGEFRFDGDCSVMMFEGCRLLTPNVARDPHVRGMPLKNGVAKNKDGRKNWLWIADKSPTSPFVTEKDGKLFHAENFIQFYNPKRLTLSRGVPVLAPVIREVDDIDDLLAFERVAAKKAASMNTIIKVNNPENVANYALNQNQKVTKDQKKLPQFLDPHRINYFSKDVEVEDLKSNHPNNTFEPFIKLLNRYTGLPVGLPIELVLLDFSGVNFASSRQLLNQAQLHFKCEQGEVGFTVSRIYEKWLAHRMDRGDYDRNKMGLTPLKHCWGYTGWPSPNPLQDIQAAVASIEGGLNSRTSYNRSRGISQPEIFKELEDEEKTILGDKLRILLYMLLNRNPDEFENILRPDNDLDRDEQGGTEDVD